MNNQIAGALMRIRYAGVRPSTTLEALDECLTSRRLLRRLSTCAICSSSAGTAPEPKDKPDKLSRHDQNESFRIASLGLSCRFVTASNSDLGNFEAFLQIYSNSGWLTIVCYEFKNGRGLRKMYYATGETRLMQVDLPSSCMLEMAGEDFQRNWTAYCEEYLKPSQTIRQKLAFPA